MGSLRTLLCSLALGLSSLGQAAPGLAQATPDPMPLLASCTGRLSALMEYQWLLGDASADLTQARRDAMAELLDAVTPAPHKARAMQLRLEAKLATALYLRQGLASDEPDRARGRLGFEAMLSGCRALIVS